MKIFLGTPITCLLDQNNRFQSSNQRNLQFIIDSLRGKVDTVFCAIEREAWGEELLSGEECTYLDHNEMLDTDIFIAIPNQSYGVYVEIGWASAIKKNIILLVNEKFGVKSPLLDGLDKLTNVKIITFESDDDFPDSLLWEKVIYPQVLEEVNKIESVLTVGK
ncbi:hypothetical protein [Bacillus mobilis]|uniref:hypothetical protein n=1 Tax=Bacillus mobilis TaxID=2026190 RepID=UPI003CEFCDF4